MTKRFCDKCGKEIDKTKPYAAIEVSVRKGSGILGPEHQLDLCFVCMSELLTESGIHVEDLDR